MKLKPLALLGCLVISSLMTGCGMVPYAWAPFGWTGALGSMQSNMGGQTLPSGYYLRDDVQYFPAGSEERLPNLKRALEEYRVEQAGVQ
jgi:hypothetical protein